MRLYRRHPEEQARAHLGVGRALGDQAENREFAFGEGSQRHRDTRAGAGRTKADGELTTVLIGFVVSYSLLGLGGLLFGIASLRAAVPPRWTSIVMIVGGVVCFAPLPARYLVLAVATSLVAVQLRSGVRTTQGEPAIA